MTEFCVESFNHVNELFFGMARDSVRKLGGAYREYKKTPFSQNTTDDFGEFQVFYSPDDRCEAVEIFSGSRIMLAGELLPWEASSLTAWAQSHDRKASIQDDLLTAPGLGFSAAFSGDTVDSILFYKTGYYEETAT